MPSDHWHRGVTIAGQPERKLSRPYVLQTAFAETIPVVNDALVQLTLRWRTLTIWVFIADIKDVFILGLDILRAYDASVDVGRPVLQLVREEVPVREAPTASVRTRPPPTESRRNGRSLCCQCGGTGYLKGDSPWTPAKEVVDKHIWRRVGSSRRNIQR